jgi:hypothetical protein
LGGGAADLIEVHVDAAEGVTGVLADGGPFVKLDHGDVRRTQTPGQDLIEGRRAIWSLPQTSPSIVSLLSSR